MTKEQIDEMIECQDVYEIEYEKDQEKRIRHISNIEYSDKYDGKCILAFCHESQSDLVFNIRKICSAKKYWIGIPTKDARAPKDGVYLIACAGIGQGIDIEYRLRVLRQDDVLTDESESWAKPIAYHYLAFYNTPENEWTDLNLLMHTWEYKEIPAPQSGIPVLAYIKKTVLEGGINHGASEYCLGQSRPEGDSVWYGVKADTDISTFFKDPDVYGFMGWSEIWDGSIILGFQMIQEYSLVACKRHIELRLKNEPNLFE